MWKQCAIDFWAKWHFPNTIGTIDGKHLCIQSPKNSGSTYFNYKEFFSIVIIAIADPIYRFLLIDIGEIGSLAGSAVFHNSAFGHTFIQGKLDIPLVGKQLPNYPEGNLVPYILLGDAAFPLRENLMKPYPHPRVGSMEPAEHIFNYRLSCARCVVENAFGILGQCFRLYHRKLAMTHEHLQLVVLHNFL